ncbi:MAG: lyase family protein [Rhodobacteraceae bacterium]|nr:lyase family protein [Paracoccaceae bacterium]
MPASPIDSAIYRGLFGDDDLARLFSDSAEVRAILLVEGALAKAQGGLGMIPETAASFLHRAVQEIQIDPSGLAAETATNGVPVPALVAAARKALEAPEHARYLHWGATSQDICDTALALRLRAALKIVDARLAGAIAALADLAEAHAETPMLARTYGQGAVPTSFGAVAAGWGAPLLHHRARLTDLSPRLLSVSLSGAAGTLSALGGAGPAVRAALATELGLSDPGGSWHAGRDRIGDLAGWAAGLAASLGKIGEDLLSLTRTGVEELRLGTGGGSSTMPQKQNPVAASALVALCRHAIGLAGLVQGAGMHRDQRDGAAWFSEWLALPGLVLATGRAAALARDLAEAARPDPGRMAAALDDGLGLVMAEALTFALAETLPRPEAAAAVTALCAEARDSGTPLAALAARDHPGRDWAALLDPRHGLGTAPAEARAFARQARGLAG